MTQSHSKPFTLPPELVRACQRLNDGIRDGLINLAREYTKALRRARAERLAAIREAMDDGTFRRAEDIRQIRRIGVREALAASAWLDRHVDGVYADLGLERPS